MSESTFDYIIAGAGSAGCVLANRLSEDPGIRVLLLEEGPDGEDMLVRIPRGYGRLLGSDKTRQYPVDRSDNRGPRTEIWFRGKMLGGTSTVNGNVWVRSQREDYDEWAAVGVTGWGWDDLAPYFARMENIEEAEPDGGPVPVNTHAEPMPVTEAFIRAAVAAGLPRLDNSLPYETEGVGLVQLNIDKRGRRVSAARAYLRPARSRPNLTVVCKAIVDKVELDNGRAVGVTALIDGRLVRYSARGEVIVSCGGVASPLLLQRSGIGPGEVLRAAGIEAAIDHPRVGRGMREHYCVPLQFQVDGWRNSQNREFSGWRLYANAARHFLFGSGPLSTGVYEAAASARAAPDSGRPDLRLLFGPFSRLRKPGMFFPDRPGLQIMSWIARPTSEGEIRIASADPQALPVIQPNYLSTDHDRVRAVAGVKVSRAIAAQAPLARLGVREDDDTRGFQSDEEILELVARFGSSGFHATSACAMGGEDAVLDSRMRVRRLEGLRVVDGSALPSMVSSNTNAPIMAMALRAADLILADRRASTL